MTSTDAKPDAAEIDNTARGRNIRIPDVTWNAAKERAANEGVAMGELVRELLRRYVRGEFG